MLEVHQRQRGETPQFPSVENRGKQQLRMVAVLIATGLTMGAPWCVAGDPLTVASDFEGASVREVEIDEAARSISFMPGGVPVRGWPCGWYIRVNGITPGETITLHVITKYQEANANLRTQFERILKRAGVEQWERLFQNLRASKQTELANEDPLHVVTNWLGNSERVASKHYLRVTDGHFEQAQRAKTSATTSQNGPKPAPHDAAANRTNSLETKEPSRVASQVASYPTLSEMAEVPPTGVEPVLPD